MSAEALQQLRHGQAALRASSLQRADELQQQHDALDELLQRQQQRLRALEQQLARRQAPTLPRGWASPDGGGGGGASCGGDDLPNAGVAHPDPWSAPAPLSNGAR